MNTQKVTRVEVIDWTENAEVGRLLTRYNVSCEVQLQDDNRTLKVFLKSPTKRVADENTLINEVLTPDQIEVITGTAALIKKRLKSNG